ncbi:MAG: hypothetical protein ACLTG4_09735 [Oscillospiraceae bacterium]
MRLYDVGVAGLHRLLASPAGARAIAIGDGGALGSVPATGRLPVIAGRRALAVRRSAVLPRCFHAEFLRQRRFRREHRQRLRAGYLPA